VRRRRVPPAGTAAAPCLASHSPIVGGLVPRPCRARASHRHEPRIDSNGIGSNRIDSSVIAPARTAPNRIVRRRDAIARRRWSPLAHPSVADAAARPGDG